MSTAYLEKKSPGDLRARECRRHFRLLVLLNVRNSHLTNGETGTVGFVLVFGRELQNVPTRFESLHGVAIRSLLIPVPIDT